MSILLVLPALVVIGLLVYSLQTGLEHRCEAKHRED